MILTTQPDSYMKVPGAWYAKQAGAKVYPHQGVTTYRLLLKYPAALKDPALRIQHKTFSLPGRRAANDCRFAKGQARA